MLRALMLVGFLALIFCSCDALWRGYEVPCSRGYTCPDGGGLSVDLTGGAPGDGSGGPTDDLTGVPPSDMPDFSIVGGTDLSVSDAPVLLNDMIVTTGKDLGVAMSDLAVVGAAR